MQISKAEKIAAMIHDAGGEVVGGTRLQGIAYLLDVAGYGDGFRFRYKHFGPYSEEVADAAWTGALLKQLSETECEADWGGFYSIYKVSLDERGDVPMERIELATRAANTSAIVLELAATAVFLFREGFEDAWGETKRRKPGKANRSRLNKAKEFLTELQGINLPKPLPAVI